MRLLGIDYGTKRVGVALSDPDGRVAFPHKTYHNDHALVTQMVDLCTKKGVEKIIVGRSTNLNGMPNRVQKDIDSFVEQLGSKSAVPIDFEPEQFSTQAALRIQGRGTQTDASAAALILDSYIMRHSAMHDQ